MLAHTLCYQFLPVLNRIMHTNSLHPDHTLGSGGVGWGTDNVHAPLHTRTAIELARYFRFSRKLCATLYKGRCGGRTNGISYIYLHHFLNLYSQCEVFLSFYFIFNLCADLSPGHWKNDMCEVTVVPDMLTR